MDTGTPLMARNGDDEYVVEQAWVLIVRKQTAMAWTARGCPELSKHCTVLVFEDLVAAYGGQERFDTLVRGLVQFDYFAAWLA